MMPLVNRPDTKEIYKKVEQIAADRTRTKHADAIDKKDHVSPMKSDMKKNAHSRTPSRNDTSVSKKARD